MSLRLVRAFKGLLLRLPLKLYCRIYGHQMITSGICVCCGKGLRDERWFKADI